MMAGRQTPQPGDEWEAPDGRRIYVDEVSGNNVTGKSNLSSVTSSGRPGPPVGLSVWAGSVSEFERYRRVGPRWKVRFDAPVQGSHPIKDPVFEALGAAGTVEQRSMPPAGKVAAYGRATYEMTVLGSDENEARQTVIDALAPYEAVSPASITVSPAL